MAAVILAVVSPSAGITYWGLVVIIIQQKAIFSGIIKEPINRIAIRKSLVKEDLVIGQVP